MGADGGHATVVGCNGVGATNRARAALAAFDDATYGIGVEGGMQETCGKYFEGTWVVVVHRDGRVGTGSSGRFEVSAKIYEMIRGGMDLGQVMDQLSGLTKVGDHQGAMVRRAALAARTPVQPPVLCV